MGFPIIDASDIEKHLIEVEILKNNIAIILESTNTFVPYTGATKDVNLGVYDLIVANINNVSDNVILNVGSAELNDATGYRTVAFGVSDLYGGDNKISIDWDGRNLYADDGSDVILNWSAVGIAQFNNSDITTTGDGTFGLIDVDNIRINGNQILSNTGTITLVDDHLTTVGDGTFANVIISGTGTFGEIIDSGLTINLGVYTDASKQLTSTPPTSGILGYWSRTGTQISTANAGDDVILTDNLTFDLDNIGTIYGASQDMKISFTGSDGKIQSNLITANDGLILQQKSVSISSTGVTPSTVYPLKIIMDADSVRGIYIDGDTNPTTTDIGAYCLYAKNTFDYSGASIKGLQVAYLEAEDDTVAGILDSNRDNNILKFDYDQNGSFINNTASNRTFGTDIFQLTVNDDGTYDSTSTGAFNVTNTGVVQLIDVDATLNDTGTNAPDNDYLVYGNYADMNVNMTVDNEAWDVTVIGYRANIVYAESGVGSTNSTGRGLYITAVSGFDTSYGIHISATGLTYAMYDNSGSDWIWDGDNQHLKIGEGNSDLDIYSDGTNGIIDVATSLRLGNGTTNYAEFSATGDLVFVGSSGLVYGCVDGVDETITCTTQNTWYQVTFDTAGASNNTTPSAANNDIVINKTGDYILSTTVCIHTSNAQDIEILIKKENGTVDLGPHLFQTTGVAGKIENMTGNCIAPITATDTLELWVRCTSSATVDVIFDHVNLNCIQIGG